MQTFENIFVIILIKKVDEAMAKRRKLKKTPLIIIVALIILIVGAFWGIEKYHEYLYHKTTEYKLLETGYSKEEIDLFKDKLQEEKLEELLDNPKNKDLIGILKEKYYLDKNLDRYLAYLGKNKSKSYSDIVAIVNVNADNYWYEYELEADKSNEYGILTNKFYKLSNDYSPSDIVKISSLYAYEGHQIKEEVLLAYIEMSTAAKNVGLNLIITSSYRDYKNQQDTYDYYELHHGKEYADGIAARAGHSEHQTGLALDILRYNTKMAEFEETEEYTWLLNNSYKYGFILRYPKDKEYLTGYKFEAWHYRYLGKDLALKVYNEGITYDEYYAYYIAK